MRADWVALPTGTHCAFLCSGDFVGGGIAWPTPSATKIPSGLFVAEIFQRREVQAVLATVFGIVLLVLWVVFLFETRQEMNRRERLSAAFLFQWNVLPFIVALELLATRSMAVLAVGILLFFICWPFAKFLLTAAPLVAGWHVGLQWCSSPKTNSSQQAIVGAIAVAIVVTFICQANVVAMRRPPRHT